MENYIKKPKMGGCGVVDFFHLHHLKALTSVAALRKGSYSNQEFLFLTKSRQK